MQISETCPSGKPAPQETCPGCTTNLTSPGPGISCEKQREDSDPCPAISQLCDSGVLPGFWVFIFSAVKQGRQEHRCDRAVLRLLCPHHLLESKGPQTTYFHQLPFGLGGGKPQWRAVSCNYLYEPHMGH